MFGRRGKAASARKRARRTRDLIAEGASDLERWGDAASFHADWDERARRAAAFVPDGSKVLDLGCGVMALQRFLAPGCTYWPADLVPRTPNTVVVDLNAGEFPPGDFDWIVALGVLEYIHDPAGLLRRAAVQAQHLAVSYCCDTSGDAGYRRGQGWVNDHPAESIRGLLEASGARALREIVFERAHHHTQLLWLCRSERYGRSASS